MKLALSYIEQHYHAEIRIHTLAGICGFSDNHFMTLFKKAAGCSCIDYINNFRLAIATTLLKGTDDSIMNIAMDTGFHNVSYFNRQFKNKCGVTPREYRNSCG